MIFSKRAGILLGLLTVVLAGMAYRHFTADTVEDRIRHALTEGRTAVEAEDLEHAVSHISAEYRDERGWTFLILRRLLKDAFAQFDDFQVEMGTPVITRVEGHAEAAFDLRVFVRMGGQKGLLVGGQNEPAHVIFILGEESRQWLVREVRGIKTSTLP